MKDPASYAGKISVFPLKVIFMSATLQAQSIFQNPRLFRAEPPILTLKRKTFPVAVHYEPSRVKDYVRAAAEKAVHIHLNSGAGNILIFLSGQAEIRDCVKQINCLINDEGPKQKLDELEEKSDGNDYDDMIETVGIQQESKEESAEPEEEFSESQLHDVIAGTEIISQSELQRLKQEYEEIMKPKEKNERREYKAIVMQLHGQLPLAEQEKIYLPLKENERLILVSTNVAESSLTVPDVKFIIDACR